MLLDPQLPGYPLLERTMIGRTPQPQPSCLGASDLRKGATGRRVLPSEALKRRAGFMVRTSSCRGARNEPPRISDHYLLFASEPKRMKNNPHINLIRQNICLFVGGS